MGTCVSIHRDPKSNMRFRLAVGTKKAYPPPSHPKGVECAAAGELDDGKTKQVDAASARWSPSFGSRDEIFFDSQAWLESDCEDFYSVNGDFTPSRGSTPNYQTGKGFGNKIYTNGFPESQPEPSPRKKLAELFQENPKATTRWDPKGANPVQLPKSVPDEEEGGEKATHCCLPSLTHSLNFAERKK
ncbi:unnamed protein product [Spirodela intermedia]|uniref:Uncharacterized protein n=1 Tax=Spirodela intermedia TaxID=51605 RepID=A0A7I8IPV1_SPIIN|nr:unnamed protein product [Spirodela intermedia]CAA6659910.1 unnamed protein product [Spirodela intermedia]